MGQKADSFSDHESILELAAISIAEPLSPSDSARLREHLSSCAKCREASNSFRWLYEQGKTLPRPPYFGAIPSQDSWDHDAQKLRLLASLHGERDVPQTLQPQPLRPQTAGKKPVFSAREAFPSPSVYRWLGAAVAACAVIAISLFAGYRLGKHTEPGSPGPAGVNQVSAPTAAVVADLQARKASLEADVAASRTRVTALEDRDKQLEAQVIRLRDAQKDLQARNEELTRQGQQQSRTIEAVSKERESIAGQLGETQHLLEAAERELATVREQRKQDLLRTASLEIQVQQYAAELREKDNTIAQEERFLTSDRDIRDLMGARQLYIADVVDVDHSGRDRKPFGRVFYTKAKSLIFYGFDLDQQTGFRNAGVFQVWGHTNSSGERPFDLGIFYKDNDANRRWVLKFNDPHTLAQIDAVFVTLEQRGPSKAPTGKPFLYTYLRKTEPNHP